MTSKLGTDVELTLQHLLDNLGDRLGRPTTLEDRAQRLIAYSAHDGPVDEVRETSILRRHAAPEVSRWLDAVGLRHARQPVRVPGNADLHMLPRVCIPVMHKDMLLGHLWFVDADGSMTPAEIDCCVEAASDLATLLHREVSARVVSSTRVSDALQLLITDSPAAAETARGLEEDGYICAPQGIVALVVQGASEGGPDSVDIEDALGRALAGSRRALRPTEALQLVRRDHCVLLLATPSDDNTLLRTRVASVCELARSHVADAAPHVSIVVGVGSHRAHVAEAAGSYREARMAADAAISLPGIGELAYWGELGINQVVVRLAVMDDPPVVHSGLHRLLTAADSLQLVETLETYLDVAGNAQLAAEQLNLHRTSLYYRLQRIEHLAGTDLKDGLQRLALHLELKVARLTGRYVPRHPVDRRSQRHLPTPAGSVPLPRRPKDSSSRRLTLVPGHAVTGEHSQVPAGL